MTFKQKFADTLANELVKAYVKEYGEAAWLSQSDEEKSETLHLLLHSFLTVAARNAAARSN